MGVVRTTVIVALMALLIAPRARAQFLETELIFDAAVESRMVLPQFANAAGAIVLSGRSKARSKHMSIFAVPSSGVVSSEPLLRLELPQDVLFFDHAVLNKQQTLMFLTPRGISVLDVGTGVLHELLQANSVYRTQSAAVVSHLDFMLDLNADGLDDIVLQDFDGFRVHLQRDNGFGSAQLLQINPRLTVGARQASYRPDELYLFDINQDGMQDLALVRDNEFVVFDARSQWSFADRSRTVPIDISLLEDDEGARFEENLIELDQSDLELSRISRITDLNSDGLPDIITFTAISSGVFEKRSEYGVHLAEAAAGTIRFAEAADAKIVSEGFQVDLSPIDVDSDGGYDLVSTSVDFGFSEIIAALFTRSLDLDVDLHRFGRQDLYVSDAEYRAKVKLKFNISTGFVSSPAVRFADFNGDGFADLMLQQGPEELRIRQGAAMGSRVPVKTWSWETKLPLDGSLIEIVDANGDGLQDILVSYGGSDGEGMRNRLRVLISQITQPNG